MRLVCLLILLSVRVNAVPPKVSELAGNDKVREIMETYKGRGMIADDTPPTDAAQTVGRMEVRSGVAVDLVVSEPAVAQPLYLAFDSRGRMWVTEYRQYQFPAGLKVTAYDQHLRARFDKVPEPPPRGVRGEDRVSVHTLDALTGKVAQSVVAIDGLNIATAALPGAGGIWVMNAPYLLFYPDADGDGRPDGDPVVEATGFGIEDTHSVANSLQWGPDGWLYGANGSTTTGRVSTAASKEVRWEGQMIWRFHPRTKVFQIYAEGGGNTFSLDFDSKGRLFSGTNAGNTRGMHYESGSYGVKGWGKHGPPMNPYAFHFFDHMKSEGDKRRFPQAFTVYEGGAMGTEYEGRIIAPNAYANVVWVSRRDVEGSTFRTVDETPLLSTPDRWFRPVFTMVGPDGGLYLADWYDTRLSHVRPVDDWSTGDGRVYRVRNAIGARGLGPFDLHTEEPERLVERLSDSNEWIRRQAVLEMGWRGLKGVGDALKRRLFAAGNAYAFDALCGLDLTGSLDEETHLLAISHEDPYVRRWAVRLASGASLRVVRAVVDRARVETHAEVLSQIAATAKGFAVADVLGVLGALAGTEDERIRFQLWWLLESVSELAREEVLGVFGRAEFWRLASVRSLLAMDLAKRWAMAGGVANLRACERLFAAAPDEGARTLVLRGLEEALENPVAAGFEGDLAKALASRLAGDGLATRMKAGDAAAIAEGLRELRDRSVTVGVRVARAKALGEAKVSGFREAMGKLFSEAGAFPVKKALLPVVEKFGVDEAVKAMLENYEQRVAGDRQFREAALRLSAGRLEWARLLIAQVEAWRVPVNHVPADGVRQLAVFRDADLDAAVERHWKGLLAVAPTAETRAESERIVKVLRAGAGIVERGAAVFRERCGACHRLFGEGGDIGPELTGYDRGSADFWLQNILTPSLEIREGYGAYVVETKDGRVLTGMIKAQDARGLTLHNLAGQTVRLGSAEVKSQTASPVSLMPSGLLVGLSDEALRDLFAYLSKRE
jgi:putative heme-binding domain-containing protein